MARIDVDIDIEDYLDEVDDDDLIDELNSRGYNILKNKKTDIEIPEFKSRDELRKYLFELMGLRPWHDQARLLDEINDLF